MPASESLPLRLPNSNLAIYLEIQGLAKWQAIGGAVLAIGQRRTRQDGILWSMRVVMAPVALRAWVNGLKVEAGCSVHSLSDEVGRSRTPIADD